MKELSIEEKAKAYDKAIKVAVAAHKDEDKHLKATLERIFPELKSEDERIRKNIIIALHRDEYMTEDEINECVTWLEKQGEQTLVFAWGEEDKKYLRRAINATRNGYPETNNWLKSLRPQNTWKPSDEQMRALHDMNLIGNISYAGQGQTLIELYNDLKKLKGE